MVLQGSLCGRVGRCQIYGPGFLTETGPILFKAPAYGGGICPAPMLAHRVARLRELWGWLKFETLHVAPSGGLVWC